MKKKDKIRFLRQEVIAVRAQHDFLSEERRRVSDAAGYDGGAQLEAFVRATKMDADKAHALQAKLTAAEQEAGKLRTQLKEGSAHAATEIARRDLCITEEKARVDRLRAELQESKAALEKEKQGLQLHIENLRLYMAGAVIGTCQPADSPEASRLLWTEMRERVWLLREAAAELDPLRAKLAKTKAELQETQAIWRERQKAWDALGLQVIDQSEHLRRALDALRDIRAGLLPTDCAGFLCPAQIEALCDAALNWSPAGPGTATPIPEEARPVPAAEAVPPATQTLRWPAAPAASPSDPSKDAGGLYQLRTWMLPVPVSSPGSPAATVIEVIDAVLKDLPADAQLLRAALLRTRAKLDYGYPAEAVHHLQDAETAALAQGLWWASTKGGALTPLGQQLLQIAKSIKGLLR